MWHLLIADQRFLHKKNIHYLLQTLEALYNGLELQLAREEEEKGEEEEEEEERGRGERGAWVPAVERALKATVVGGLLLPLLVVVRDRRVCTLTMANFLQKSLHPLVQLAAQVRDRLRRSQHSFICS